MLKNYKNGSCDGGLIWGTNLGEKIKPTGFQQVLRIVSGKTGIRTLGTRKGTTVFETVPIDHSGIFPGVASAKVLLFFHSTKFLSQNLLNLLRDRGAWGALHFLLLDSIFLLFPDFKIGWFRVVYVYY